MTTQTTYIPKQHNAQELAQLIESAINDLDLFEYYTTYNTIALLENHTERLAAGQVLSTHFNHVQYMNIGEGQIVTTYTKESQKLAQEIADTTAQVTTAFEAEIEADRQNAITIMANAMVDRKREARLKELAEQDAKELAEATAHATQVMEDAKAQATATVTKQAKKLVALSTTNTHKEV